MKRKYGIALILCLILIFGILGYGYAQRAKQIKESETVQQETVSTQGDAEKEEGFCLAELNGYVVVYKGNQSVIYEYTNILVSDLPEELQTEIRKGKQMNSLQEVYGFLENYSS